MKLEIVEKMFWPTYLWECPVKEIDNKSIKEYCLKTKETKPGINISNKGGWHSKELITPLPLELKDFFQNVVSFSNEVLSQSTGINNLILGNWWININGKHDYNIIHNHRNSILSGVYYVSVPESNMGNLILHRDDTSEYFLTSQIERQVNPFNSLSIECPVEESKLLLFPSWIKHSVERNESNKERISIAFNLVSPNQS